MKTGYDLLVEQAPPTGPGDVDFDGVGGMLDLRWGYPDPLLFPAGDLADATAAVLADRPWLALSYGQPLGPPGLRRYLSDRSPDTTPDGLLITAGASQGLDLIVSELFQAGDAVLLQQPTYHLAEAFFTRRGIPVFGVEADGLGGGSLTAAAQQARTSGFRPTWMYLVSTRSNPTGHTLPVERRQSLVEEAGRLGVTLIDDDPYREIGTGSAPPSLRSHHRAHIRLGSFSKTLSPGLRVGLVEATPYRIRQLAASPMVISGGGPAHFAASVVGRLCVAGAYQPNVERVAFEYGRRLDALVGALDSQLFEWSVPDGGFFVWLRPRDPAGREGFVQRAASAGVALTAGSAFFLDRRDSGYARASISLLEPDHLRRAAEVLNQVARTG
jgi:DNA-binding transcriptional MocR family regulator